MPTLDSGRASATGGISIKSRRSDDLLGIAFQDARSAAPTSSNDFVLYRRGSSLYLWDGSGETQIVAGGAGGSTPSWETLFSADATFTITPDTTFTIAGNRSSATDVLTLSNIAGGSGAVLAFSNSGTGNDVDGTSDTWSVTKAGVATFAGVSISGTTSALATTGAADWTLLDNNANALTIGASGAASMLNFDTRNGAEVVGITANFSVAGTSALLSTSNTVAAIMVSNDTVTTFGNGTTEDEGVVVFSSDTLTTGALLNLELTEGTLNGGWYLRAWDATGSAAVFSVGEDGAIVSGTGTVNHGGAFILSGTETIAAGGTSTALSLTKVVHYIDADAGGDTFTLADGTAGQIMTILLTSSTGTATITPTNLAGGTSVTLNADGDTVVLQFMDTEWFILGGNSYAVV